MNADPKVFSDLIGAGAVAIVSLRAIPLLRMSVRLLVDIRRRLAALELGRTIGREASAAMKDSPNGTAPALPSPAPDELELAARSALGDAG